MLTDDYKLLVFGPTGPELWPLSKLQTSPTAPTDPVPVTDPVPAKKPVAGDPRHYMGKQGDDGIYECTINGVTGLIQVVSDNPDAFLSRGYNLDYESFFKDKPTGPETSNYGNDPLFDSRPAGYRKRYFPGDGRMYWEQSDLPDEPDPAATKPTNPAPVQPIPPAPVADYGDTVFRLMNSHVFMPHFEWKDGMVSVYNMIFLNIGPGEHLYVSEAGQPPQIGLPIGPFRHGQEVSILVYVSTSPDLVPEDSDKKAQAWIYIGNPPKTT